MRKNARSEIRTLRNSRKDAWTGCYGDTRPIWPLNWGVLADWAQIEASDMFPVIDHWMDLFWGPLVILPAAHPSAPWCGSTDPGSALRGAPPCRWCLVGTPQQQPWGEGERLSWRGGGSCLSEMELISAALICPPPPSTDTPSLRFVFSSFITEFSLESHGWRHRYFLVLFFPSKCSFFISLFSFFFSSMLFPLGRQFQPF